MIWDATAAALAADAGYVAQIEAVYLCTSPLFHQEVSYNLVSSGGAIHTGRKGRSHLPVHNSADEPFNGLTW